MNEMKINEKYLIDQMIKINNSKNYHYASLTCEFK